MKKYTKIWASLLSLLILSVPALIGFGAERPKDFKTLIEVTFIGGLIRPIVPLLVGLAVVIFLYGVILRTFSEDKQEEGKQYMFWGIVGIFVMVSVWGLVAILQGTFNLDTTPQTIKFDPVNIQ